MVLERFNFVQAAALFDLVGDEINVFVARRGHFKYVADTVENDDEYLWIFAAEKIAEWLQNALLQHVGHLFGFAA